MNIETCENTWIVAKVIFKELNIQYLTLVDELHPMYDGLNKRRVNSSMSLNTNGKTSVWEKLSDAIDLKKAMEIYNDHSKKLLNKTFSDDEWERYEKAIDNKKGNSDLDNYINYIARALAYPGSQAMMNRVMRAALDWQKDPEGEAITLREFFEAKGYCDFGGSAITTGDGLGGNQAMPINAGMTKFDEKASKKAKKSFSAPGVPTETAIQFMRELSKTDHESWRQLTKVISVLKNRNDYDQSWIMFSSDDYELRSYITKLADQLKTLEEPETFTVDKATVKIYDSIWDGEVVRVIVNRVSYFIVESKFLKQLMGKK